MRLIDADALSETMYHEAFETDTPMQRWDSGCWIRYKMFETAVENAPTIEPEQRWIPVSERLPEDYTDVLVWFEYFRYGDYNCLYQTYGIGDYIANYGWMINHETGWHKLRVIAWMPLPEPYRGEE